MRSPTIFCPEIDGALQVEINFRVRLHQFRKWKMGRYAKIEECKIYPCTRFFWNAWWPMPRGKKNSICWYRSTPFPAVAAGKWKSRLKIPVVMNFPDLLTGFMETWPAWMAPRPLIKALERYEIFHAGPLWRVDGALAISDTLADYFVERGFPREKIQPIYYGYDSDKFPFRARPVFKDEPSVVAMHGSFDAHHLGKIAREAIEYVTKRRPEVIFRFIGRETGSLQNFLATRATGNPRLQI